MIGSIRIAAVSGRSRAWSPRDRRTAPDRSLRPRGRNLRDIFLAAGGERRQRAAVEGALEGDDAVALGMAVGRLVFARRLDRAFHRLGAGIAEEHDVGEACLAQPLRDALGFGNLVKVGDVPQLLRLLGERGDEMRMRVAERVDGDAGGKIEIALAVGRDEPTPSPRSKARSTRA
jgi:hypothetical protein